MLENTKNDNHLSVLFGSFGVEEMCCIVASIAKEKYKERLTAGQHIKPHSTQSISSSLYFSLAIDRKAHV